MDLIENSSQTSGAHLNVRKSTSHMKLTPLRPTTLPVLPAVIPSMVSLPSSQQELMSSSGLNLQKKSSSSDFNDNSSPTRFRPNKKVKPGYQLASFPKALEYLQTQSYNRKVINPNDGEEEY